jgi:hypothetical protein
LRIYDIADLYVPREIAYFIPPDPTKRCFDNTYPGRPRGIAENVLVDNRGPIFMDTSHDGLYVLKCTV